MTKLRMLQLQMAYYRRQMERCDDLLTKAGVPEWVENTDSDGVPGNSIPERLKWYLARRKDVKPSEIDKTLALEMTQAIAAAAMYHGEWSRGK